MSKKGSNPKPPVEAFRPPPPPSPPPRKIGSLERVAEVFKSIEEALKVPGRIEILPGNMTLQCIEEPRKIIRELLDALTDTVNLFSDNSTLNSRHKEVSKNNHLVMDKAEAYLKEISGEKQ